MRNTVGIIKTLRKRHLRLVLRLLYTALPLLLILAGSLVAALPSNVQAASGPFAYIANYGSDSVSVIPPSNSSMVAAIPTAPTNLTKISPDNNPLPAFKWTAATDTDSGVAAYEVQMDGGTWINIGNRLTYIQPTVLSKGSHTFSVRAKDAAGNTGDSASLSFVSWVVDLTTTKVAFDSSRDGNYEIYVMNTDGSSQTRLTNNSFLDRNPSWSPDGSKIAFYSQQYAINYIYVMNADGSNQTNLTNNPATDWMPVWSPDGTKIAFCSQRDGNNEIYVMNADGSNQTNLTKNTATDWTLAWSPDGSKIAFCSYRDGNYEIYVMNTDGSNPTNLTTSPTASDQGPSWSPDGSKIAFFSYRGNNYDIYVMNAADGKNQTNLTKNPGQDYLPAWSPLIDTTPPDVQITGVMDGAYYIIDITPVITATDLNLKTSSITLNGNPFTSGTPITNDGQYTLVASASDLAGNNTSKTVKFVIDKIAPDIQITGVQDGAHYNTTVTPVITINEPNLKTSSITLNNSPFTSGTPITNNGQYTLVASASDLAGNSTSKTIKFIIDKIAPDIQITGVQDGAHYNATVTPVITINEPNLKTSSITLNNSPFTSGTPITNDGQYTLVASASDMASNSTSKTVSFVIDKTPVANAQSVTTAEDTPLPITLTGSGGNGNPLTFSVATQPTKGTLSGTAPNLTYTPNANYNGPDSFTFTVSDGNLTSAPATVSITITPVNDPPVANNDSATTPQGTPINIPVLANDSDVDGDTLTVTSVTQGANGSVAINPDGTVKYAPNPAFSGNDSFTYTISDGKGSTVTATVSVAVTPVGGGFQLGQFVAFSTELTWLREGSKVITGDVGANASLPEPKDKRDKRHRDGREEDDDHEDKDRDKRVEVIVGEHVKMIQSSSNVVGDTVWLRNNSKVYNIYYNELIKNKKATILGSKNTPLTLPVLSLPALPTITPGTKDIEVKQKQSLTLSAGSYRKITVKQGGTLILTGGTYQVSTLDIRENTNVLFKGKSEVRVKNEMDTDAKTYIGPDPSVPSLKSHDIIFYVEGTDDKGRRHDDDHGTGKRDEEVSPTVVQIGVKNTMMANIYAPSGTVWLKEGTKGTGAFIGKRVRIGEKVELNLDSAF